jgi:MerR family transcriptional regulator, thiopeptide resistance regulator
MKRATTYKIGKLARISGVSIRTLHHYDEIGLLKPADRTGAGYRVYDADSLLRLQQILINRSLGLSLEAIRRTLDDPDFDLEASLTAQLAQLEQQAENMAAMIRSVKNALDQLQSTQKEQYMDLQNIFEGFDPSQYEPEVRERWGDTDAYAESAKRTMRYGKADWQAIMDEQDAIFKAAAGVFTRGLAVDDPQTLAVVERHRLFIDRWFYPCSIAFQSNLGVMWEADARFAATIDGYAEGLTAFLVTAIRQRSAR